MVKPKHNKDQTLLDDVEEAIDELAAHISRFRLRNAAKKVVKVAQKADVLKDDLAFKAKSAARDIKNVAADLVQEATPEDKMLRELKRLGDEVEHKVNRVLKHASRLAKEVKTALEMLKDAIVDAFNSLGSVFKNIFSTAVPHGAPVLTPHQQRGKTQQQRREQSFQAHQHKPPISGAHRKVSPGGKKGS